MVYLNGIEVLPARLANSTISAGYYVDRQYNVWSTKKHVTNPIKINGSESNGRLRFSFIPIRDFKKDGMKLKHMDAMKMFNLLFQINPEFFNHQPPKDVNMPKKTDIKSDSPEKTSEEVMWFVIDYDVIKKKTTSFIEASNYIKNLAIENPGVIYHLAEQKATVTAIQKPVELEWKVVNKV